ncbi:anti-sigma factor antagonist [bacterium]|nr:anti-sigma factor antagonist [bacterium]
MNVETETLENMIIVRPIGKLDALSAPKLQDAMDTVLSEEPSSVVVDMGEVPYVSSAGLRVLLKTVKALRGSGKMVLCQIQDNVKEVLTLAGFEKLMTLCDDLESAKASL